MNSVQAAIFVAGPETGELVEFLECMKDSGVLVTRPSAASEGTPLVVLITSPDAEGPELKLCSGREILPVTFLDEYCDILPELSHLLPRVQGREVTVARLVSTVRYGGQAMVEWERLCAAAEAWHRSRSPHALLAEPAQIGAGTLLNSRRATINDKQHSLVQTYLTASRAHIRRQRRFWKIVLTVVAIMLTSATVIAGVQSVAAITAARHSTDAANTATARRLTQDATEMMGRDPDLPLALAATAEQLTDDHSVRNAIATIAGKQISHTSIRLAAVPRQVVTSESGFLAYTSLEDSLVRVIDAQGRERSSFSYLVDEEDYSGATIALSPDGSRVAVEAVGQLRVFETRNGEVTFTAEEWSDAVDTLQIWWNSTSLLVGTTGGAELLDISTGDRKGLVGEGTEFGIVRAAAISPDGETLALTDQNRVQVWDLSTRTLLHSADMDNITSLAVNDGGKVVFGARHPFIARIDFTGRQVSRSYDREDHASVGVATLPGGYFAGSDRQGRIAIYPESGKNSPAVRFQAHLDDKVRITTTIGGDLVSIGFDRYLRIWNTSKIDELGTFTQAGALPPDVPASGPETAELTASIFPSATLRNQIRVISDNLLAVVLAPLNAVAVIPASATEETINSDRAGMLGRAFLSNDARNMIIVHGEGKNYTVEIRRMRSGGTAWNKDPATSFATSLPMTNAGPGPFLVTTGNSNEVALATTTSLSTWNTSGAATAEDKYSVPAAPIALTIGDRGEASVVTLNGMLYRSDGSQEDLLARLPSAAGATIAAAEFADEDLWLLTSFGAIIVISDDGIRVVAEAGTVAGTGTLRVSPDEDVVAHIGADKLTLVRSGDGTIIGRKSAPLGVGLEDVAFTDDSRVVFVITDIGSIARWELIDMNGNDHVVVPPRALTLSERLSFNIEGADG